MSETVSFEEYIDKYGSITYRNKGVSMLPLLREGKDIFTVEKKGAERCKRGDVVLFKREPDEYILHRVVEVRENDYVILGDNCINPEYGIKDEDILGVMTSYVRNGKEHKVTDADYKIYESVILNTAGARIFAKRAAGKIKRTAKRIIGKNR